MTMTLKTKAVAAFTGLAALLAVPAAAVAGSNADADIWLKKNGQRGGNVIRNESGHVVGKNDYQDRDFKRPRHHHNPQLNIWIDPFPRYLDQYPRHYVKVRRCSVDQATWKAQDQYGLRRVRVDYVTKHVIGVTGRRHGEWRDIVFSRAPGCPVINY